ncbi:uncharacterized protein LOC119730191 [Patiria miniata]|uniref:Reverse transcriptase n=1 Tax=Patiria miniata TaxID=46514 RepID=A0A914A525_PATMI|nr:uncharacterized protein LOC119730191 [Patiria miniata]
MFHTKTLNLPYLPQLEQKCKINLSLSIFKNGGDPMITQNLTDSLYSRTTSDEWVGAVPKIFRSAVDKVRDLVSSDPATNPHPPSRWIKQHVRTDHDDQWESQLQDLQVQSKLLDIIVLEDESEAWKCVRYSLPSGQLAFLIRAGCDTLPSPVNLARWKVQHDTRCGLCHQPRCTLAHILSACQKALTLGHYTWRHDCVLKCIARHLAINTEKSEQELLLRVDLPGMLTEQSTIPASVCTTNLRPDIFLQCGESRGIVGELTIPNNSTTNLENAKIRKSTKYLGLVADLSEHFEDVDLVTLEVGALGHYHPHDLMAAMSILMPGTSKRTIKSLLTDIVRTVVNASYTVFSNRRVEDDWAHKPFIYYHHDKRVYEIPI